MSTTADSAAGARPVRHDRVAAALLWSGWVAAGTVTVAWAVHDGNGPGTMGMSPAAFEVMWLLMMTAMMLPTAMRFARSQPDARRPSFAVGYLAVWAATGAPAYLAASGADRLAGHHPLVARIAAVAVLAGAGMYQLSNNRARALRHCRMPTTPASVPPGWQQGLAYGGWCVAGSWAAMAALLVLGVMNVAGMAVIGLAVYAERFWFPQPAFRRIVAAGFVAAAAVCGLAPRIAAGLHGAPMTMMK